MQTPHAAGAVLARAHRALLSSWIVRPGQTLSGIAGSWCGAASEWTGLYAANKAVIGADPDVIQPGQHYSRGCYTARTPVVAASPAAHRASGGRIWGVSYGFPNYCGDGDDDGYDVSCASIGRGGTANVSRGTSPAGGTYHGSSSFEQCVIARESGGNSQVMNSSGHYGLYQFSASTWQAYGGSAASFGHASVAEQRRVFDNAIAQGGQSNWSPYDGC
jgi:hypothetical protein